MVDKDLEGFLNTLAINEVELQALPAYVGDLARYFINESNVGDILKILANSKTSEANQFFWEEVNGAPCTEEGWNDLQFLGGGIDAEGTARRKLHFRRSVEAVRKFIGQDQVRKNALFRPKA